MTSACCDNDLSPPSISMVLSMVTMWREQGHCMYFYVGHLPYMTHHPRRTRLKGRKRLRLNGQIYPSGSLWSLFTLITWQSQWK